MTLSSSVRSLGLALALLVPVTTQAQWNAANDFSIAANPNGVWSYGFRDLMSLNLPATTTNYATSGNMAGTTIDWWSPFGYFNVPSVYKNTGATTQSFATVTMQAGQLAFHPGLNGAFSIVRFTAPTAGIYSVSSVFTGIDNTNTDVHVLVDGASYFNALVQGYGDTEGYANAAIALNAGSLVEFAVGYGQDSFYGYDSTGLDASISQVVTATPEPASVLLMATGMIGLGAVVRRRRVTA